MKREIEWIDIDKLVIDGTNVREEQWDADEEFVKDVKTNEILNPLLTRPLDDGRFGVVCGSRRFNASIDAGLSKVPCVIEEMDDITALGRSIAENKYTRGVEPWMYAVKIGLMYGLLGKDDSDSRNFHLSEMEKYALISTKTGLSSTSVQDYIAISTLPKEILELMKSPEHRSKQIIEKISQYTKVIPNALDVKKAVYIARNLKGQDLDRMFETAVHVMSLDRIQAKEFIHQVKSYPKMSPSELYKKMTIARTARFMIVIELGLRDLLDEVAVKKHTKIKELITSYIREGLRRDGCRI